VLGILSAFCWVRARLATGIEGARARDGSPNRLLLGARLDTEGARSCVGNPIRLLVGARLATEIEGAEAVAVLTEMKSPLGYRRQKQK
jgi:hypothetical protein